MAKFYIATSLARHTEHNLLRDTLTKQGHEITYDWTLHEAVGNTTYSYTPKKAQWVSHDEKRGVLDADIVILLLPGGKGTHTELGLALASEKPIIVHSEEASNFSLQGKTCVFYFDELVTQVICSFSKPGPLLEEFAKRLQVTAPV